MKKLFAVTMLFFVSALFGCGGGGSSTGTTTTTPNTPIVTATSTPFTNSMLAGNTYAFDFVVSGNHVNPTTIVFNADGTGMSSGADNGAISWVVDIAGRLIITNATTGLNTSIALTDKTDLIHLAANFSMYNTTGSINTSGTVTMTMTAGNTGLLSDIFTSSLIAGKTVTMTKQTGAVGTFTFPTTGNTFTYTLTGASNAGTYAGTYTINANGQLLASFIVNNLVAEIKTYTIVAVETNSWQITAVSSNNPTYTETGIVMTIN